MVRCLRKIGTSSFEKERNRWKLSRLRVFIRVAMRAAMLLGDAIVIISGGGGKLFQVERLDGVGWSKKYFW